MILKCVSRNDYLKWKGITIWLRARRGPYLDCDVWWHRNVKTRKSLDRCDRYKSWIHRVFDISGKDKYTWNTLLFHSFLPPLSLALAVALYLYLCLSFLLQRWKFDAQGEINKETAWNSRSHREMPRNEATGITRRKRMRGNVRRRGTARLVIILSSLSNASALGIPSAFPSFRFLPSCAFMCTYTSEEGERGTHVKPEEHGHTEERDERDEDVGSRKFLELRWSTLCVFQRVFVSSAWEKPSARNGMMMMSVQHVWTW